MVLPGAVCGIMAAQSLVEPLTQGMLDSLHGGSSGAKALLNKVKDATTSKELSIYAKELTISFIKPYCYDKTFVEDIKEKIISVTLNKLITEWQVFLETFANPVHPRYKHEGEHIKKYAHSYAGSLPNNISKWCIRLSLDKHMMALKYVSLEDISLHLLEKFTDIFIVPCSSADTYLRIYIMESEFAKVSDIEKYVVDTFLQSIIATYVKGIPSILDASVKQAAKYTLDENTGEFIKTDEYVIKTVGSNHADLLNNDSLIQYIDVNQLLTNDVSETIDIFGIEAARTKTIDQIMDSIGKPISYAHVTIYADTVTWTGELVPLEKTIAREKNKTLLKASWNFASKNLTNGAKIGTYEEATNITTSVLMGNVPKVGTHYSNILMDEEIIMKNTSRIIDVINSL
jgi:DNA-directed RNA polymerase II subunit RPB1